ncbi:hypothetical protein [Rothia aeria]|uniref:hypothetical protein n=1 Tax=Rothia aeria TaxID=172042 RepID=UPI001E3B344F|nr:hypothetical protein [Rothia aeria]MDK7678094.1 hypothetical protein [Rothia aeria]
MANFVCILSPSPTIFKGYAVKNTAQVFQARAAQPQTLLYCNCGNGKQRLLRPVKAL